LVSDENLKNLQRKYDKKLLPLINNIAFESNKIKSSISNSLVGDSLVSSIDKNEDNNSSTTV
jgi:hypothetical protein